MEENQEEASQTDPKMDETAENSAEEKSNGNFSGDREMFKSKCSDCGNDCEVPFKPEEGRPVRCQECFQKNRPRRQFNGGGRNNFRKMHDAKCSDCGKECQVPFKPTGDKPVLCRECYSKSR